MGQMINGGAQGALMVQNLIVFVRHFPLMKVIIFEKNEKLGRSRPYGQLGRPGLLRWLEEATRKGTRSTRVAETAFYQAKVKNRVETVDLFPFS